MVGRNFFSKAAHQTFYIISFAIFLISLQASAETLFEGYYKVISGGTHVGFSIIRYEFDSNKKQFIATTFLKTGELGGNITESLKATATEDLKPISYQSTSLTNGVTKTIDAKVEKNKFLASIKDGSKVEKIDISLPKGAFLSTFLTYLILKSKQGIKADTKYDYQAIAEEDGKLYKGLAFIKGQEEINGNKLYKVINEFKTSKFTSNINERGEVFLVKDPALSISQELVAQPSLATGNFQLPTSLLKVLFGEVPTGQINELSKKSKEKKAAEMEATPIPGKQYGVPGGKGILLKSQPAPSNPPAEPQPKNQ